MMNETIKAIAEYGILIVIAGVFLYSVLHREKKHDENVKVFVETTAAMNETAVGFNLTVSNHLQHEEEAFREMVKSIDHLCWRLEGDGSHDYRSNAD